MRENIHVSPLSILLDGEPAPPEVFEDLTEVMVDLSLHLPGVFSLRLNSRDVRPLDSTRFGAGTRVEILSGAGSPVRLMSGLITGLELDLDQTHTSLLVRGFDQSYRLYRDRPRRSFVGMTDSELAKKLAFEAGLKPGVIEPTRQVQEYLFQNNQTNAEFLHDRARRLGFEVWVHDGFLHFRSPARDVDPLRLVWGGTLLEFRPRFSLAGQLDTVEVRGWDPEQKRELIGRAKTGHADAEIGMPYSSRDGSVGLGGLAIVDQPVSSLAEADRLARAVLDEAASAVFEADGVCDPTLTLIPGRQVRVEGVGKPFSGSYFVTRVTHRWRSDRRMVTNFSASGRRDRALWSLLEEARPRTTGMNLAIGIVTVNRDPQNLGRIRVRFPWLSNDDESAWVRIAAPMAGGGRGFFCLPEIGDEVLIGFEHGDLHRPFMLGALWNRRDPPPLEAGHVLDQSSKVVKRVFRSRSGHTITLDDTDGAEEISIVDKTGKNQVVFHSLDNSLRIEVQGELTLSARGRVKIVGEEGVEINGQNFNKSGPGGNP